MAETVSVQIEVDSSGAGKGIGNLKQQLREATNDAQKLSEKFGATSKEAINAAQRAAQLKEEIADVRQTIDALHPEAKFNAILGLGQGIAGGFAAAQGAMALFGAESDNVQKALLKVQAAMAISQGLNEINGLRDSFTNLGIVIKSSTLYTKVATAAQTAYNFVVGAGTAAMKVFRVALAATGIGAVIIGITLLVQHWEKLTAFVKDNAEELKKWGLIIARILFPPIMLFELMYKGVQKLGQSFDFIGDITDKIASKFGAFKDQIIKLLEQVGILNTAEESAAEDRLAVSKKREAAIKREIEIAKAQGASAEELAALDVKLSREKFLAYNQYVNARLASGRKLTDEEREQVQDLAVALKVSKEKEQEVINQANQKRLAEQQKAREKRKALEEQHAKEELDNLRTLEDLKASNIESERERELKQLEITFQRKIEAIKGQSATEIEIRKQLAIQQKAQEQALKDQFDLEDREKEASKLQLDYENRNAVLEAQKITDEIKNAETKLIEEEQAKLLYDKEQADKALSEEQKILSKANYEKKISDIEKTALAQRLANEKQIESIKVQNAKSVLSSLSSIADIGLKDSKKNAAAKKAIGLAEIAIDTAIAIAHAVKNAQTLGFPASIPVTLTTVAMVLANIASAKKLIGGGGPDASAPTGASVGGGGASNGVVGSVNTAPRTQSQQQVLTQLSPEERGINVTVNAKVLETDMTDSQKRVSDIKDKATF